MKRRRDVLAKLNAKQIEVFAAVMTHGSITSAAHHLNASQPTVSRMIERFEHEAGFVAFIRRRGKLVPTPEADIFFAAVRQVYRGPDHLNVVAREIGGGRRSYLRVGVFSVLGARWLSQRIARYMAGRDDLLASVMSMSFDSIIESVARQTIDFGITPRASGREGIRSDNIWCSEMVCILPKGHRLTGMQSIKAPDISGEDFISLSTTVKSRAAIDTIFNASGIERRIRAESLLESSICHLVSEGLGMSIVSREAAEEFAHLGYSIAAFKPRVEIRAYLVSATTRPLSAAAEGFREMLLREFNRSKSRG
jgi:DNA-binding transcriptional LysR family regulator